MSGKILYRFPVPEARRLASLAGIATDLQAVVEYCRRLESLWLNLRTLDFSLSEALSTAAVVRYGRCFKSGVRERLPEDALDVAPAALRDTHKFVIELRDKHVAHSVNPFEENEVAVQIADHYVSSEEIFSINTEHGRAVGLPSDKPVQLRGLAEWWMAWLEIEMIKEKDMLLTLAKSFTLEELKRNEQSVLVANTSPRTVGKRRSRP